jgi:hypothetical protein
MTYMPQGYEAGKFYSRGSVVNDGTWTMIATALNLDYPFPLLAGDINWGIATFVPTTQSDSSVVYSGHIYTINESVYATAIRIWVAQLTVDTHYRVVIVQTLPNGAIETATIENPILAEGAWTTVALLNQIIQAGTTIKVFIDALNSGADNEVTGGWTYTGQDNVTQPNAQSWNQNNARTIVRIDKTDLDGDDRAAELSGIGVNSTLVFADTNNPNAFDQYRVTSEPPVDQGSYFEYSVVLQEQGEGGVPLGVTTMTATIPIAQPTEYAEQAAVVPVYTQNVDVVGFLEFGGVDQAGDANTYGVDIELEGITGSENWDVFAYIAP